MSGQLEVFALQASMRLRLLIGAVVLVLMSCASGGDAGRSAAMARAGSEPEERLVYSSNPEGSALLYSVRPNGSGVQQVSSDAEIQGASSVSPDGSLIAFEGGSGGTFSGDIYTMRWDGSNIRRLTGKRHGEGSPHWSPSQNRLVFVRVFRGPEAGINTEIYTMRTDGKSVRRLTDRPSWDYEPEWSPSGEKILFVSTRDGDSEIFVMDPSGQHVRRLTENKVDDLSPSWSPNGRRIVFLRGPENDTPNIFTMTARGADVRRLTSGPLMERQPVWSPDGKRIAFIRGGPDHIYIINRDGSGLTQVTTDDDQTYGLDDWAFLRV